MKSKLKSLLKINLKNLPAGRKGFTHTPKFFGVPFAKAKGGFTHTLILMLRGFFVRQHNAISNNLSSNKFIKYFHSRKKTSNLVCGFTLIELLVVIAIIGILSSVVFASLNNAKQKSRDTKRISDIKQLQIALEFFYDANSEYPDDIDAASLVTPGYIVSIPLDPRGVPYYYDNITNTNAECDIASGVCTKYHIGADLEDTNHSVKDSDTDFANFAVDGIDGDDADGCANGAGVLCYDLTP